jgi:hypothetical protein
MTTPRRRYLSVVATLALAGAALTGCPPPDDVMDTGPRSDVQPMDMPVVPTDVQLPDVPLDAPATNCPANPPVEMVTMETITADTNWDCNHTYVLAVDNPTFVLAPAVLRIGPGTVIRGDRPRSSIIITRGARIEATGTAAQPIVFTSNKPVGMRRAGDWGGVALLGTATINSSQRPDGGAMGENQLEGIDSADMRGRYGGAMDTSTSGIIRYARIEFAGYTLSANNELNGLTLCACGSGTIIDYVQLHRGADDGIEIFGGTVNVRHIVSTLSDDDGFDWDQGWRGKAQFVLIQGPPMSGESDPSGIEADNDRDVNTSMPTSEPTIYNISVFGPGSTATVANMRGAVIRRGTGGHIFNMLLQGWPTGGIDVRDAATFALTMGATPRLTFENSIVFQNGAGGTAHFTDGEPAAMPDMFDEAAWFMGRPGNLVGMDTMVPAPSNPTTPNFVPPANSPAASGGATPPAGDAFFDATATYRGAVPPGQPTNWMSGWTAFPEN